MQNYLSIFFWFSKTLKPFQTYYPFTRVRGRLVLSSGDKSPTAAEFQNNLRNLNIKLLPCASERGLTLCITGKWRLFREIALQSVYFLYFTLTAESWLKVLIHFQLWNQMYTFKRCSQSNQNNFWVNSHSHPNLGWGE